MSTTPPGALVRPLGQIPIRKMHDKAHPLVRQLFSEAARLGLSSSRLETLAGLAQRTTRAWAQGRSPNVRNLEAALAVVGLEIVARRPEQLHQWSSCRG